MKKLNFGCGLDIKEGFDNFDKKDFDFEVFPYPIKDNTYDYIFTRDVLEHLRWTENVLNELHRICKTNGIIEIYVPHFNNEGSFSMLGHVSYFAEATFEYLTMPVTDWGEENKGWEIVELEVEPSPNFGVYIPKFLRRKLSLVIRGVFKEIHVKLKVIK
ncbi:MAG: class I SAM-dependent methyltransferase [Nanoarchaeota archaeon]|nr:class I SAM-dependent methyltransferase [Nanoarchaeota archaeon]MBU1104009.1 class I SAM-dependent methyltransferase [Nanoarchaeota archaeon]MBU1988880.1 class I SAM-dependent methyltransferase [Nanoarchaeota archaeon]